MPFMLGRFGILFFTALFLFSSVSFGFPDRPVKVIVPFSPGGGSDTFARIMLRTINSSGKSSEPWVVVNIPGAGGVIGSRRALNAAPDGHTLLFLHDGIVTARYSGLSAYGPEAFEPIAGTGTLGAVICVGESTDFQTLPQLLDYAAENPDTVTFAANIGAPSWFMARVVLHAHGTADFRFVQSGGGARRFSDLIGDHVTASAFSVAEYLNFKDGGLRALVYLGKERHSALPEVPSAGELGLDADYQNLQAWWAPKGTPPEKISMLSDILESAMQDESFRAELAKQQIDPVFLDSGELAANMQTRAERIESLGLAKPSISLPRLEIAFLLLASAGGLLAFRETRRSTETQTLSPVQITDPTLLRRAAFATGSIGLYLVLVQFTAIPFEVLTFLFILTTILWLAGRDRFARTLLTSFTVPLLGYLFLHRLLGLEMP